MFLRNITKAVGRGLGNVGGVLKAIGSNDAVRRFGQSAAKVASTGLGIAAPGLLAVAPELAPAIPLAQKALGALQGNTLYNNLGAAGSAASAVGRVLR